MQEAASRGEWVPADINVVIEANEAELAWQEYAENEPMLLVSSGAKLNYARALTLLDGVSASKTNTIYAAAAVAKTAADNKYDPENEASAHDTYRHFYWNYTASKSAGSENCRIFTTNYEWSGKYGEDAEDFYLERFEYWATEEGGDSAEVSTLAQAEANAYLKELRDDAVSRITSLSKYKSIVGLAAIQDYYNNYMGQQASADYSTVNAAYEDLKNSLATGDNPTSAQIRSSYNSRVWEP